MHEVRRLRIGLLLPTIRGLSCLLLGIASLVVLSAQTASAPAFIATVLLAIQVQFQDTFDDGGRSELLELVLRSNMLLDSRCWISRIHVRHRLVLHSGQILRLGEVLLLVRRTLVCYLQIGIREVHVELGLLIRRLPVLGLRRQFIRLFRFKLRPHLIIRCSPELDYVNDANVVGGGVNRHLVSLVMMVIVACA